MSGRRIHTPYSSGWPAKQQSALRCFLLPKNTHIHSGLELYTSTCHLYHHHKVTLLFYRLFNNHDIFNVFSFFFLKIFCVFIQELLKRIQTVTGVRRCSSVQYVVRLIWSYEWTPKGANQQSGVCYVSQKRVHFSFWSQEASGAN